MADMKIDDVLAQLRVMSAQASATKTDASNINPEKVDFGQVLKSSVNQVNDLQQQAGELAKRFELGDESVDLSKVMIEMQKARVSFETLSQVRNRLVSAYQEIMNMQI